MHHMYQSIHKYAITDISLWCDLLYLLEKLGKDLRNPHFICPTDLKAAHDRYIKKAAFLNLVLTDGLIIVKVLQSVDEFYEEGKAMHHCVYTNAYYNDENSLILSAGTRNCPKCSLNC